MQEKVLETKARGKTLCDSHRKSRNKRFPLHGYRWLPRLPSVEGSFDWILLDPTGRRITEDDAESRIGQKRYGSQFDGWQLA